MAATGRYPRLCPCSWQQYTYPPCLAPPAALAFHHPGTVHTPGPSTIPAPPPSLAYSTIPPYPRPYPSNPTGISEDKAGLFARVRITTNWTARVHQQCAVWCPECKEDAALPNYYHYLGPAVRRGRALRCSRCTERGATVGCFAEGCPAVYHLPCAVDNGCLFNVSGWGWGRGWGWGWEWKVVQSGG